MAYPTTLDSLPTDLLNETNAETGLDEDKAYEARGGTPGEGEHAERHNAVARAVNAIEEELGTEPSGASATVKARLEAVGLTLASKADLSALKEGAFADVGTGSTQVAAGNDGRFPTSGQKNALAGTSGTPGEANKYVTNSDSRNSDARTPLAHAASHKIGGTDPLALAIAQIEGLEAQLDYGRRVGLREKMWWACSDMVFNPALTTGTPANRQITGARFAPPRNLIAKGIAIRVTTAATKNDEGAVMLYDATGATLLAKSGAVAGKLNALGMQTFLFEAPFECKAGTVYYPMFQYGTTLESAAALARIEGANQVATMFGAGYGERLVVQPAIPATFPYAGALAAAAGSVSYASWVIEA